MYEDENFYHDDFESIEEFYETYNGLVEDDPGYFYDEKNSGYDTEEEY